MEAVFQKPLVSASGLPSTASEETFPVTAQVKSTLAEDEPPKPKTLLVDQLNPNWDKPDVQAVQKTTQKADSMQNNLSSSSRPLRTTRNSRPLYESNIETVKEPVKYSEEFGLGRPWSKYVSPLSLSAT
jgi:hypothetical protein